MSVPWELKLIWTAMPIQSPLSTDLEVRLDPRSEAGHPGLEAAQPRIEANHHCLEAGLEAVPFEEAPRRGFPCPAFPF